MDNEIELDRYLNNQLAYTRALANAKVYSSSEGDKNSMIELKKIDPKNVKFMGMKNIEKENGLIFEKSHFEILLPNGERTILTVDKNGNDMSCDFIYENGKSQKFLLTPRMQSEIMKNCVNGKITGNVDMNLIQEALFPESQEDMEKEIAQDTLIPEKSEETVKKIKEKNPNAVVKAVIENEQEIEQEENGCKLKQVLLAQNPQSVMDQLEDDAGLDKDGSPVYCVSFANSGAVNKDRVIFVQDENLTDDEKYYADGTRFMNNYANSKVVDNIEDNETKVLYTDLSGNKFAEEMKKEPRDLRPNEKEILKRELEELEEEQENNKNSNIPLDEKLEKHEKINELRIQKFDDYGIEAPEIRDEIKADKEIANDIKADIASKKEELEDDEFDPRDPRYGRGNYEKIRN